MEITTITLQVALQLSTGDTFNEIGRFCEEADSCDYTEFTHSNFFYSYPTFGQSWENGKSCQFHQLETKCHFCDWKPERNYAGVGTMFLLHNGIGKSTSRMLLVCPNHIANFSKWRKYKGSQFLVRQLELF